MTLRIPTLRQTQLYDEYKCPPAARKVVDSVFRSAPSYNTRYYVDLNEHNTKCNTMRKTKYAKSTMKGVKEKFLILPNIKIYRKFTKYKYEIAIIPFSELDNKKFSESHEDTDFEANSKNMQESESKFTIVNQNDNYCNPQNEHTASNTAKEEVAKSDIQQQQYIWTYSKLAKGGFKFAKEIIWRIAKYGKEAIAKSIDYIKIKKLGRKPILNPEGYFLDCLERGYWKSLKDRDTNKYYWQEVVDRFRESAVVLASKFKELPIVEEFDYDGNWNGAGNKVSSLIELLGEDWYGEELISSAIAWGEEAKQNQKQKPLSSRRRRGKGFGV